MSSLNKILKDKIAKMETNSAGTPVRAISAERQLERLTLAHMLFEDQFYVGAETNAQILARLTKNLPAELLADTALRARTAYKLRHVPLFLLREMARHGKLKAEHLSQVIQRPDEIGEFIAMYWKDKKQPLSNQVKKGLAQAFDKFNEFQFSKWNKNSAAVKLRDALFLVHAKPKTPEQEALFQRIASDTLETADTWETNLSGGADKRSTFIRLMDENKLGALAFLRNLRNMVECGVPNLTLEAYAARVDASKVLPFRYVAAARVVPQLKPILEKMMFRGLATSKKLQGRTVLVVDTSGSMGQPVSSKSEISALDAACALAVLAREICEDVVIYATAGSDGARKHATMEIPGNLRGFALADYISGMEVRRKIGSGGIFFAQAMEYIASQEGRKNIDRVLVFTDEQDTSMYGRDFNPSKARRLAPNQRNYVINVGTNKNGINSAEWESITGFSEAVIDYIQLVEQTN
jgi:hypothetical protein